MSTYPPPPPPPPWAPWWYVARGRGSVPNPDIRVSDAERSEVADVLTKHFADGRLDQGELDERLHRAMAAKTRGELSGVLGDLPPLEATAPPVEVHRRRGTFALLLVTLFIFAAAFSAAAWTWHFPWVLFAIIFFVFWRRSRWGWHRHWGWHGHGPGPGAPVGGPATWWMSGRRRGWWV